MVKKNVKNRSRLKSLILPNNTVLPPKALHSHCCKNFQSYKVQDGIFALKKETVTAGWKTVDNEVIHHLYSLRNKQEVMQHN
jgi:hypothetical protein